MFFKTLEMAYTNGEYEDNVTEQDRRANLNKSIRTILKAIGILIVGVKLTQENDHSISSF